MCSCDGIERFGGSFGEIMSVAAVYMRVDTAGGHIISFRVDDLRMRNLPVLPGDLHYFPIRDDDLPVW